MVVVVLAQNEARLAYREGTGPDWEFKHGPWKVAVRALRGERTKKWLDLKRKCERKV